MENFYREFRHFRCTELQLKMRLASLHLQLKRVAHEQNTRLAVHLSSRAQQGNVADKQVFCEWVLPFEVAAGRPSEYSISSDNLNWGNSRGKICHWVLYGILRFTIFDMHTCTHTLACRHAHTNAQTHACMHACTHAHMHAHTHTCMHTRTHACTHAHTCFLSLSLYLLFLHGQSIAKWSHILSVPIAQFVKASQRFCFS